MIGILVTFLASACLTLSNLFEKHAVDHMAELSFRRPVHMARALLTSRWWVLGFLIGIVGVGLVTVAFSLVPIAVVQAILGAGLAILVFASRLVLRESVGGREYLGVGAVVVATILVSLSLNSHSSSTLSGSWRVVVITSLVTTVLTGVVFVALLKIRINESATFGLAAGLLYGVAVLQTKGASLLVGRYGVVAAIPRILASPYPYLFVIESLIGLYIFQSGLQRCQITIVAPLTSIIAGAYVVAVGMAVFGETLPASTALSVVRFVGFALVLVGTWALSTGPAGSAALVSSTSPDRDSSLADLQTSVPFPGHERGE